MPERIPILPEAFFEHIQDLSFHEIADVVAGAFLGEDVPAATLSKIVRDALSFDCPVVPVIDRIWSLELFHGPPLSSRM